MNGSLDFGGACVGKAGPRRSATAGRRRSRRDQPAATLDLMKTGFDENQSNSGDEEYPALDVELVALCPN